MKIIRKIYINTDSFDGISYPTLVENNLKLLCHKNTNTFCKTHCSAFTKSYEEHLDDTSHHYFVCSSPGLDREIVYEIIEKPVEKDSPSNNLSIRRIRCTAPESNVCKNNYSNETGCFAGHNVDCEFRQVQGQMAKVEESDPLIKTWNSPYKR